MQYRVALASVLLALPVAAAYAQEPAPPPQETYERCLAQAAVRAANTDVRAEAVFDLARRDCAEARSAVARQPQMLAALEAADASRAASYPDWISRLRERRQLRAIGLPIAADPGYR